MDIWRSMSGMLQIQITSPDPHRLIRELIGSDVEVFDLHESNDLTVSIKVRRKDVRKLRKMANNCNAEVKITGRFGAFWMVRRVVFRPVIMLCIVLLFVTLFYFPSRIFFVQVEGNDSLPDNLILSCAEECGIGFGADRSEVRSEKVKNMLLSKIPQLQWIGVNTQGCTAVISVREKSQEEDTAQDKRVCSIVAVCDGVVDHCTVYKGNALCRPGMAVKKDQVLVSGFTDCGIMIQATQAEAEIFGTTKRQLQLLTPAQMHKRNSEGNKISKLSLIIGKKQIKFYKDSGISDVECVKMKKVKYLTLPGGYRLPIAFVREWVEDCGNVEMVPLNADWLDAYAENYLRSVMTAGRILNSSVDSSCSTEVYHFSGTYNCYELIGIPEYEETIEQYG